MVKHLLIVLEARLWIWPWADPPYKKFHLKRCGGGGGDGKMSQWIKLLADKPDNLNLTPKNPHSGREWKGVENHLPQVVLWPLHPCQANYLCVHTCSSMYACMHVSIYRHTTYLYQKSTRDSNSTPKSSLYLQTLKQNPDSSKPTSTGLLIIKSISQGSPQAEQLPSHNIHWTQWFSSSDHPTVLILVLK